MNKFDSFTGQPFPGTEKGSTDQFGRRKESAQSLYDMAADQDKESSQEESPEKVRYEPHLIEADSRGQIRGIFRMNPKFDPSCKVIKDPRSNTKKSQSPKAGSPDRKSISPDGRRSAQLLTKDEQLDMISIRKSRIDIKFKGLYERPYNPSQLSYNDESPQRIEVNSIKTTGVNNFTQGVLPTSQQSNL